MEPAKNFGELASNFKSLIEDFANLSKEKMIGRLGNELGLLRSYMDELKLQAHLGKKEAQDQVQPILEDVQRRYEDSLKKLERLKEDSGGAFQELQSGLMQSVNDLREALRNAATKLR